MKPLNYYFILCASIVNSPSIGQTLDLVTVTNQSITIPGMLTVGVWEKDHQNQTYPYPKMFYAFADGDEIIIDFSTENKKGTQTLKIKEYDSPSVVYSNNSFQALDGIKIKVPKTAVYQFEFATNHIFDRSCKLVIRRIPASEQTKNYNPNIVWKDLNDTSYTSTTEQHLVKTDTVITNLIDQVAKVHSSTNNYGNRNTIDFQLPSNTLAWSYYIGVNQEGKKQFDAASQSFLSGAAELASSISGYGMMAALALNAVSFFSQTSAGENVHYWFTNSSQVTLKNGDVVSDHGRMTDQSSGKNYLILVNDKNFQAIDVMVKITAVSVSQVWESRPAQKMSITTRKVPVSSN